MILGNSFVLFITEQLHFKIKLFLLEGQHWPFTFNVLVVYTKSFLGLTFRGSLGVELS